MTDGNGASDRSQGGSYIELTPFAFLSQKGLFTKIMTFFDSSKGVSFRVLPRMSHPAPDGHWIAGHRFVGCLLCPLDDSALDDPSTSWATPRESRSGSRAMASVGFRCPHRKLDLAPIERRRKTPIMACTELSSVSTGALLPTTRNTEVHRWASHFSQE